MSKLQILNFLAEFITVLKNLVYYLVIGRVILSWVNMGKPPNRTGISGFIYNTTEPLINMVKLIPHKIGMIDLSPIILLFGIEILASVLLSLIYMMA